MKIRFGSSSHAFREAKVIHDSNCLGLRRCRARVAVCLSSGARRECRVRCLRHLTCQLRRSNFGQTCVRATSQRREVKLVSRTTSRIFPVQSPPERSRFYIPRPGRTRVLYEVLQDPAARDWKKKRNINSSRRGEGPRDVYPLSDSSLRYDSGGWAMGEGKITVLWLEKGWCTELGRPCVESNVSQSVFQGGAPCR
jgi:hypothetical protein